MPWPVYLAFKQLFPTGRISFFTLISVMGVGLGVALMLVSTSVMGGFGHQIQRMIIDTQGEVQIRARGLINPSESLEKTITSVAGVTKIASFAQGIVMMEHADHPGLPVVQGYDLEKIKEVIPIERYIVSGSLDDLDDDSVIIITSFGAV